MVKKRNGAVDFWRFVFAAILVIFHSSMMDIALIHPGEDYVFPFQLGSLAVEFFLLTSGFLFAKSMNKSRENNTLSWKGMWTFMKGKLMSFYPAYLICLVLTFIAVNLTRYLCHVEPYLKGATKADDVKNLFINFGKMLYESTLLRNFGLDFERLLDQAWYLSAMMLVLILLYPIYAKNKRRFENFIAPVLAIALLGFIFLHSQSLLNPSKKYELFYKYAFTYKGNVRAMAEICLGVVCWRVCEWLKRLDFTKIGKVLLAVIELFGYGFAIVYMHFLANAYSNLFWHRLSLKCVPLMGEDAKAVNLGVPGQFNSVQFVMLFFLAVSVTITFSEKSAISRLFNHKFFTVLGQYSLYPYLLYSVFSANLPLWIQKWKLADKLTTDQIVLIYCALTFVTAAIVMAAHMFVKKRLKQRRERKLAAQEG
jgi:peptidoglycan/LPS O-acetylase OafA/YrhL